MFGIGGGELVFIIFIALMLFGADKIPDIARTMGKIMRQVKDATDDIKYEITKSAESNDIDLKSISKNFTNEVDNIKQGFNNVLTESEIKNTLDTTSVTEDLTSEIKKTKEDIENFTGPIKRQL
ncbi:twin-arginine translocase TatA/TatE family subunit [Flavobacterium sp.]|uniref:Sec-independent protein translocase subunit TatA/TatB n=1 Tax=Flavobacterium sp. TaxID=239 RepID=UPI00286D0F98|nr:twin-arginine translocase TatA/TatE family subunit [Flavobacterium sp.]